MTSSIKYVGMDVHKESISVAVRNAPGKVVMECIIETKASMILQFFDGLRGDGRVTFEEGTWAAAADFCRTIRVNCFTLSHDSVTCSRSPEVSSTTFHA